MGKRMWLAAVVMAAAVCGAGEAPPPEPVMPKTSEYVKVSEVGVRGTIEGSNITFRLTLSAEVKKGDQEVALMTGDVVLVSVDSPTEDYVVRYDRDLRTYFMHWPDRGTYAVSATFAARARIVERGEWREAEFLLPASRMRTLSVECDRSDLEVRFPGALRLDRQTEGDKLVVSAILGPGLPFQVRWKPEVQKMEGKLVLASDANTIATVGAGALRLDTVFAFDIAQGEVTELGFSVPPGLSVTQVRGEHIQDWRMEGEAAARRLKVVLNLPQTREYRLQVLSETALAKFPTEIELPVIQPEGGIRAGGCVALGTDSAIHLVVKRMSGLSQIEAAEFPRVSHMDVARPLPKSKAFYYAYASTPYQIAVALDDIVPSFDAEDRMAISVREDDLTVEAQIDLDVRDAPVRSLTLDVPAGFVVSGVAGQDVDDHTIELPAAGRATQGVVAHFNKPVLGRTLIGLRMELGRSPLGAEQRIPGLTVRDARSERGYLALVAEGSVQLETPKLENLREVNTASIPMRVANAQFAYRFREPGWSLTLLARKKPAGIMAEAFHLVSLGEGAVYGYVVVNYFISGAPVDEFQFRAPKELQNVEFIGADVQRWSNPTGDVWTVKLGRKVIGDYNLAVSYSRRFAPGDVVSVGDLESEGMETQTGYLCVASHLNVKLAPAGTADPSLLELKPEELPANYRLLVSSPILRAYKYVAAPHRASVKVEAYERGAVLPVVVDLAEIGTTLNVKKNAPVESVTRIRYKVKNSSAQFLALSMPQGATIWATRRIDPDGRGGERQTRLTASFDPAKGLLMAPLDRLRDPNDPITLEVEYGQSHGDATAPLRLTAPACEVESTFSGWTVQAPEDWAVLPAAGSNMIASQRPVQRGDLSFVAENVTRSWAWAFERGYRVYSVVGLAALGLFVITLFVRRSAVLGMLAAGALAVLVAVGVQATRADAFGNLSRSEDLRTLSYTQALSLAGESGPTIAVQVTPAWRRYATWTGAVILPAAGLACLVLALLLRRLRPLLAALGLAGLAYGAAQFPAGDPVLGHALTWGAPSLLLLALIVRSGLSWRGRLTPAAVLLAALLAQTGWASAGELVLPDAPMIQSADYHLKAEKDSMAGTLHVRVAAPDAARLPLLPDSAVLLTPEKISEYATLEREEGRYVIALKRKGLYEFDLTFLCPLDAAREDQLRSFHLSAPVALTKRVELTVPATGMEIESPTAIVLTKGEADGATTAAAVLGPEDDIFFLWKPRARETKLEKTSFFAELVSVWRFDTGLAEGSHRIRFQIAQGELKEVRLRMPDNAAVTAVEGANLGAWRYDPASHELEARLSRPVTGEYALSVTTQTSSETMPYETTVRPLVVLAAERQRAIVGLTTSATVYVTPGGYGQPMNVDDFRRDAAGLLAAEPLKSSVIRYAYRVEKLDEGLKVTVNEVRPEIRASENAGFTVSDERLLYNGTLDVEISKAGLFSVDLKVPDGYDIDELSADEVSHWDENATGGARTVQVHFKKKLLGRTALKITLSRPVSELPGEIAAPRIEVVGAIKHVGSVLITSDPSVRLAVAKRDGVSELNAAELGVRARGALAFKLLRPDWALTLSTEVVQPRVTAEYLHVAQVSDGLVRHTHYLVYEIHNAGCKVFEVQLPKEALGLAITGPDVAHLKESTETPGLWRVELAQKYLDQQYRLTIRYETQFDRAAGQVRLTPVKAVGPDLQSGHVVVYATERTELAPVEVGPTLQAADARNVPDKFGAGGLFAAAYCYACNAGDYALAFRATRHGAAALLDAEVQAAQIQTVVNDTGESINRVQMLLRVGSKRHLEARLPQGAQVWSLRVKGRSEVPSLAKTASGEDVVLVPLAQAAASEVIVEVDLIYVAPPPTGWRFAAQRLVGPRFDLPLKQVQWLLFLPPGFDYSDFDGTLSVNEESLRGKWVQGYDSRAYDQAVKTFTMSNLSNATEFQRQGEQLAVKGDPYGARQALESAYNYSFNDVALNEDTRVKLHQLMRQQAVVGLVGVRGQLRQQKGDLSGGGPSLGAQFSQEQADRVQNSLSKPDSDNLEKITQRLIAMQEAAAGARMQLTINMPLRGRVIELQRPIQVKPDTEMTVSFRATEEMKETTKRNWTWSAGVFGVLLVLFLADRLVLKRVTRPRPPAAQESAGVGPEQGDEGRQPH